METPLPPMGYWWLPLVSLFVVGVSLYVDGDLRKLLGDIDNLEKLKYDYKKV
jgi:hypothetical protein